MFDTIICNKQSQHELSQVKARIDRLKAQKERYRKKIIKATETARKVSESKRSKEILRENKLKWKKMLLNQIETK